MQRAAGAESRNDCRDAARRHAGAIARPLDVICMGRAAVDLYGEQIGGRLEDMRSFAKYLGGSPANTAVGVARLGLKPAMLTRVGDEHNGRFVRERLAAEGVDVSHVKTDPARLTALVFLGIRDADTFPLVFYRDRCADMAIDAADFDAAFIGSARALLLSGTHLSQPGTLAACRAAVALRAPTARASSSTSTTGRCCGASPARGSANSAMSNRRRSAGSCSSSSPSAT